ncbi:MAG TPA: PA14 domain-containing protein [Tepidisphaeraceae bacterium]|nr:PA14 domain-containing protein [Tepidisphaeraceae bacterium]
MRERVWGRAAGTAFALACALGGATWAAPAPNPEAPIIPGWNRMKDEGHAPAAEQGQILLGELNCLQCHAAPNQKRLLTRGAPDLSQAGARLTPQYIRAFLSNPHGVKPGTPMPDLFHASDPQAKQGAIDYLTQYLVSLGGPIAPSSEEGNNLLVDQGRTLYHQVGCVACHAPEKNIKTAVPSVPLPNLAEKTSADALTAFLLDPVKVRPGSRMPNLNLTKEAARAISVYLLRAQLDNPQSKEAGPARVHGLKYKYYHLIAHTAAVEKIEPFKTKSQGNIATFSLDIPGRREQNFAVVYSGAIHAPRAGKYRFYTNSDDGSRLYIDGHLVVDNDGVHPATEKSGEVELREGDQPITVSYFQGGGESVLKVEWEGPGLNRQEVPADVLFSIGGRPMVPLKSETFVVDKDKAAQGAAMFSIIGCVHCHAIPNAAPAMVPTKALADLNPDSATGCLGAQIPKSVPDFHLSDGQRVALKAALKNVKQLDTPLAARDEVMHLAAAFNCLGCHVRGSVGGPTADRAAYFVMSANFDMGDEGRLAPRLTNVGAKLTTDAMRKIIFENQLHVRPVLATHMPSFAKDKAGAIVDALAKADEAGPDHAPPFNQLRAKDGRQLVGVATSHALGLGCVNCHGVNGIKSLGMPAPDLGTAHERLRYGWFHALLANPPAVNPGTRMVPYWANGEIAIPKVAGGTMDGQIAAIWDYLSLGKQMAPPAGLQPAGGDELVPTDSPIVHRTFMTGAGNRSIAVGFPEMIHVAFDADVVRLALAWKGRFFDASGMWEGRGGNHLGPLGTDVITLPPGPSFAILPTDATAWPLPQNLGHNQVDRNLGGRFKGYTLDKEDRPIFHYILDDIDIHEQPLPVLNANGGYLERRFQLAAKKPVDHLYFLAAQGKQIEPKSPGEWVVDGKLTVRLAKGAAGLGQPAVRESAGSKQLLFPVTNGTANFILEMQW